MGITRKRQVVIITGNTRPSAEFAKPYSFVHVFVINIAFLIFTLGLCQKKLAKVPTLLICHFWRWRRGNSGFLFHPSSHLIFKLNAILPNFFSVHVYLNPIFGRYSVALVSNQYHRYLILKTNIDTVDNKGINWMTTNKHTGTFIIVCLIFILLMTFFLRVP